MIDSNKLSRQLSRHEGRRLKPYYDTVGVLTIGVGRNLDDVGISESEANILLKNDIQDAQIMCLNNVPGFKVLDPVRQAVCVNMMFNLGCTRFSGFKRMWRALLRHDYEEAARQMLDSKWADQVKGRALELADQMREGVWRKW